MAYCKAVYVSLIASLVISFAIPSYSQVENVTESETPQVVPSAEKETNQPEELSIYGEVQSVNAATNSITVQYYDYDSDEEKTMEVISNTQTIIENVAALNDVKKGDWVDVTYSVSEGKNIAKSIVVEKEEEVPL